MIRAVFRRSISKKRKISSTKIGLTFIVAALAVGLVVFHKEQIGTWLRPGEVVKVRFAQDYRLQPFTSKVKVSGVPVGVVKSVQRQSDGSAAVELKVDSDIPQKLRASPTAVIRATTLLGGNYYVDLIPGGPRTRFSGTIPVERTKVPVELQQVVSALQPNAIKGMRSTIDRVDKTLQDGGTTAIDRLLAHAPDTLGPANSTLRGLQGRHPDTDLTNIVRGLESTGRVLTEQEGQLASTVQNLSTMSSTLGSRSTELASTVGDLPQTLDTVQVGLRRAEVTLGKLRDTAKPARPVVQRLDSTLRHADPVLIRAKPVVRDLRRLLADARPLVRDLVPTARGGTSVLDDVRGPVLDRVNGPIKDTVLSPYKGKGLYEGSGSDKPFYQELGYMIINMDRISMTVDGNGQAAQVAPGIGGSLGGTPLNVERLMSTLAHLQGSTADQRAGK